ncbi:DUF418 domain-containing protein [Streptomyces sp. MNP-20]|uniref:DUF418 domain-containing protein n=1 Tax=Streptomyces sp. MNP-20 TaxID=2721165 RepID=UPI002814F41A|nr:DUF418 domain-containing protein [Streptomyces sp. MNP-20]
MTETTVRRPAVTARARLTDVDALRGFALLGILLVNIHYLASAHHGSGVEDPAFGAPLDTAVRSVTAALFEAKFFLLFSFLFGYSFTLQLTSAERAGARFAPRFLRRLAGLFVLGVLHAVLLFPGDILTTYAALGLILLSLRRMRPRTAVRLAVALCALTALGYALLALVAHAARLSPDLAAAAAGADEATAALRSGPASVVGAHLDELPDVVFLLAFFQAPAALAAFLLGLAAGRRQALADLDRHQRLLRRLQAVGFPVGLAGGVVYAHASLAHPGTAYQVLALGVDVITAPLLAAAYAATVLRVVRSPRGRAVSAVLAPAGRMTLTNYLTQSLVCALLFTGYGAALVGRVSPLGVTAVALALFAVQAAACRWWLRGHPYGPVEWLLRAVTHLARPGWRTDTWAEDRSRRRRAAHAAARERRR